MRIALISTDRTGGDAPAQPLAGRSVAVRQVDLALALGCDRIVCLAGSHSAEFARMQHAAEKAGARFDAVPGPRMLGGIVRAADEILVIAAWLLADRELVADALGGRPGILTLPAEKACAAGFERIDRDTAWAGVMLAPGVVVERLADLPSDSDPASSLLRIAMQHGVRRILIAPSALDGGDLALIGDAVAHSRAEKRWIRRSLGETSWRRPAAAVVAASVRLFAPRLLARRRVPLVADIFAVLLSAGAGLAAWSERPGLAMATLALSAASFVARDALRRIERGGMALARGAWWRDALLDAVFAVVVVVVSPRSPQIALFAALVMIVAVRLAALHGPAARIAPASDRILVFGTVAIAAAMGEMLPVMAALALATLAADLLVRTRSQLTQA